MMEWIKDNITYRLGRSASENFRLLDDADPDDWWFHLEGHPSGHLIVESTEITPAMAALAATLVREHSNLKDSVKKVKVIYTRVRNVTKTKVPGRVLIRGTPLSVCV